MKQLPKSILGLTALAPLAFVQCSNKPKQPNIIFFLVDDYGVMETSLPFGPETYPTNLRYNTPNMERLSKMGVMMTNAYAASVSTPTRTCLMTGVHPAHTGITSFGSLYRDIVPDAIGGHPGATNENLDDIFAHAEWNHNGLCPIEMKDEVQDEFRMNHTYYATPLPKLLREAGYTTIHVGKAHWAPAGLPGANPYNFGFDVQIAGASNGHPQSYLSEENYGNMPGGNYTYAAVQNMTQYYGSGIHLTEALTREALKTLDTPIREGRPFYLYFAEYTNHTPIQPDDRFVQKYRDAGGYDEKQACYASMVESMDKSLGDVLDFIEEKGIADNTILIFYSDNGGHSVGTEKGGQSHTQNLPLREGKASVYEGGVHVPLMFYWKGHFTPDTRINTPVGAEDMFPTILELAGVRNYTVAQELDGQSLVRLVTEGSKAVAAAKARGEITDQRSANAYVLPASVTGIDPERPIVSHYPHQYRWEDQDDIDFMSAVREGDWKLVYRMHTAELELYNLNDDIGERNNLAAEYPERVASMAKDLGKKLRGWNAPMPTVRATGKKVPMPDEIL